jgi:hypothetical protein
MCVQEEITQGVVSLSVETGKMTADLLQKAVKKVLEEMQKKPSQRSLHQGKQMYWTSPDFRSGWCRRTAKNGWQLQGSTQKSMAFRSYRQKKKSLKMRAIYEKISGLHPLF